MTPSLAIPNVSPSFVQSMASAQPQSPRAKRRTPQSASVSAPASPSSNTTTGSQSSPRRKKRKTSHDQLPPWLRASIEALVAHIPPLCHTPNNQVDWERFNVSLLVPALEKPWDRTLRNWPLGRLRGEDKHRKETNDFEKLLQAAGRLLFREILSNDLPPEEKAVQGSQIGVSRRTNTIWPRQLLAHDSDNDNNTPGKNTTAVAASRLRTRHVLKLMLAIQQLKSLSKKEYGEIRPKLQMVHSAAYAISLIPAAATADTFDTGTLLLHVMSLQKDIDGRLKRYFLPQWYIDYGLEEKLNADFEYAIRLFIKGLQIIPDYNWLDWSKSCLNNRRWSILNELAYFHNNNNNHSHQNRPEPTILEPIISLLLNTSNQVLENSETRQFLFLPTDLYQSLAQLLTVYSSIPPKSQRPEVSGRVLAGTTSKTVPRSSIDVFLRSHKV